VGFQVVIGVDSGLSTVHFSCKVFFFWFGGGGGGGVLGFRVGGRIGFFP